jgi:hypothetical protein
VPLPYDALTFIVSVKSFKCTVTVYVVMVLHEEKVVLVQLMNCNP